MSNENTTGDKTLRVSGTKTLSVRRNVESGKVRQNFSHGRSKSVVVEKKKRRIIAPPGSGGESAPAPVVEPAAIVTPPEPAPAVGAPVPSPTPEPASPASGAGAAGNVLRSLTDEERDARANALIEARQREAEERVRAEAEAADAARRQAVERAQDAVRLAEQQAAAPPAVQGDAAQDPKTVTETPVTAAQTAQQAGGTDDGAAPAAATPDQSAAEPVAGKTASSEQPETSDEARQARPVPPRPARDEEEDEGRSGRRARPEHRPTARRGEERRRGRLTLANALSEDEGRERSMASIRRQRERARNQGFRQPDPKQKRVREVVVPETITVQELANRMAERAVDIIRMMMKQGHMLKINDVIDADTAELIVGEMGHSTKRVAESDVEEGLIITNDKPADLKPRPPVVTIMGHVDHGKTSLLDALRKTNVLGGEAGGITQHIGAYQVDMPDGKVSFIDTPGHAAFTAMRARGAKVTDIVVLVVAGDDGVMPQTVEAINHARAAEVPIIVAINKMDKADADPTRVRTGLLQHEVVVESMGGDVLDVEVSAVNGQNLDKLLETILLQAELLELKANPDRAAEGIAVETKLDKGRGPVATVLVQHGVLRIGDIVVIGAEWGKVRALLDDRGEPMDEALPSTPVEILGLNGTPNAGDQMAVVEHEARAREVVEYRRRLRRDLHSAHLASSKGSLEHMMNQLQNSNLQEFPLLIKADVQGSVEAITGALDTMSTDEVAARIVHRAVGGITESDVTLATASEAAIIAFNVRANKQARDAAQQAGTEIRYYSVIYDLIDDIKAAMSGLLAPEIREEFIGYAEILEVFSISKVGKVAGCRITEGKVERGAGVRLLRDDVVIHEGRLATLKRFKDEVRNVIAGQECGMGFENYQDIRPGDVIECFRVETVERKLA